MENKSNISLGGTKILLALLAQKTSLGKYNLSWSFDAVSNFKKGSKLQQSGEPEVFWWLEI